MPVEHDANEPNEPDRREFLGGGALATGAMAGGLVLGYGAFFSCAGQFLYPSEEGSAWMFVTNTDGLAPGEAMAFESPTGIAVVVTRKASSDPNGSPEAEDFLALSSVCPHLGCRVHWEPQNDRFFCPCHLGAFDQFGKATAGPPLADGQDLPQYPMMVANGLLYIHLPIKSIDPTTYRVAKRSSPDRGDVV